MKALSKIIACAALATSAAHACDDYDSITKSLIKKYHEAPLMMLTGSAMLEFWGGEDSWTLIRRDVVRIDGKTTECAKSLASGGAYRFHAPLPYIQETDEAKAPPASMCMTQMGSSIHRDFAPGMFWRTHGEQLAVSADTQSGNSYEIYTSADSWSVAVTFESQSSTRMIGVIPEFQRCSRPITGGKGVHYLPPPASLFGTSL